MTVEAISSREESPSFRQIFAFSAPLVLTLLTTALHSMIDTLFIARLGSAPLAAVPFAAAVYIVGWILPMGLMRNAIAFIGRAQGAGRLQEIGFILAHYRYLALLALPVLLVFAQTWPVFSALGELNDEVSRLGKTYLDWRAWDAAFSLLFVLYGSYYHALGNARTPLKAALVTLAVNVVLDYALIFGHFGFPAMGVAGSALATVIAQASGAAILVTLAHTESRADRPLPWLIRIDAALFKRILRVGLPQGLGDCAELCAWVGFLAIVGRLGETALAASNIGIMVTHLLFLPGVALGTAAASYMGRLLGAGQPDAASHTVRRILILAVGYMSLLGLPLWFTGEGIARAFTSDDEVIRQAALMFKIMALYQAFDGAGIVLRLALAGAGDTRIPTLLLAGCALGVMFPLSHSLAQWTATPLTGAWLGAFGYIAVLAGLMFSRFRNGRWTQMKTLPDRPVLDG